MEFRTVSQLVHQHALAEPGRRALVVAGLAGVVCAPNPGFARPPEGVQSFLGRRGERLVSLDYATLDARMDRVAAALQHAGVSPGEAVAICAGTSLDYACVFLGALRCGVVVAPLAPGNTPGSLQAMVADAGARLLFTDAAAGDLGQTSTAQEVPRIALDGATTGLPLESWLDAHVGGHGPTPVAVQPAWPFNIIYSSGTTGVPKGILQSHAMRWAHVARAASQGYGPDAVTLLSTPLYSNTTLPVFLATLAYGGCALLMPKFDATAYLQLAQAFRATHTMLVPVQYQRIMQQPDFGDYDLSSFHLKFCTSAPFHPSLKADIVRRWPGGLVEIYGMTEGGGTCMLYAHLFPDKLHTVGRPVAGHDIRLIDEHGVEAAPGTLGEIVGHSSAMMTGYHGKDGQTREAEWFAPDGRRFIRTGDIGRFDADGFLTLFDRKKDVVISGGFNIYPSDLEALLRAHPDVADVAVVGVPSDTWGETPVAFVVARAGSGTPAEALRDWLNQRVGKTQRLSGLRYVAELPRSAIGKVLKRDLRSRYGADI